jgi:hypothetical protein
MKYVVTIHRSQEVLKMLPLCTYTSLSPAEEVLICPVKLFYRNIFFRFFFRSGVTAVNNPRIKNHKD